MKKRMLATLLALSLVLSLGAGALAADGDGTLWFTTEDGQTEFTSETPATVTMSVTVPEDGTYAITSIFSSPEGFSVTWDNEDLSFLADMWFDALDNEPVELAAGDYSVTAENVTYVSVSLVPMADPDLPDDIPPAAERVNANFRFQDGDRSSSLFEAEEPSSVTMTATVEQDGLYLVDVSAMGNGSLSLTVDSDALAFMNQLPLEYDGITYTALAELTAGEYTLQVENSTYCYVKMGLTHPLDAVDGVIGEGLYVCQLDEAMTVDYTLMGLDARVDFYTGQADSLEDAGDIWLLSSNSGQTMVDFEPGTAVIDFRGGDATCALVGSTEGVHAAAPSEPIEFGFGSVDESGAVQYAATVPADGYYLFAAVDLGDAPIGFSTDLPIQMEPGAVPDWTFSEKYYRYELRAAVELTAGDYTATVSMADFESGYIADLIPAQMVDSLAGSFTRGGVYMCALSEPTTVTFTVSGEGIAFYGGSEGAFLQDLTPAADGGTQTVQFPAGIAVIDTTDYSYTSSIVGTVA